MEPLLRFMSQIYFYPLGLYAIILTVPLPEYFFISKSVVILSITSGNFLTWYVLGSKSGFNLLMYGPVEATFAHPSSSLYKSHAAVSNSFNLSISSIIVFLASTSGATAVILPDAFPSSGVPMFSTRIKLSHAFLNEIGVFFSPTPITNISDSRKREASLVKSLSLETRTNASYLFE